MMIKPGTEAYLYLHDHDMMAFHGLPFRAWEVEWELVLTNTESYVVLRRRQDRPSFVLSTEDTAPLGGEYRATISALIDDAIAYRAEMRLLFLDPDDWSSYRELPEWYTEARTRAARRW